MKTTFVEPPEHREYDIYWDNRISSNSTLLRKEERVFVYERQWLVVVGVGMIIYRRRWGKYTSF